MKTKSKFTQSLVEARRIYVIMALLFFLFLASEKASAQNATGVLAQTGTGLTTFTIDLSTTTTFQLNLDITNSFLSTYLIYFLQSNDGSGLFTIIGRDIASSPYVDLTTSDAEALGNPNGILNPSNARDLGAAINNIGMPLAAGSYFVATLTLQINGAITPGTYHIFLDSRSVVDDQNLMDHTLTANTVTINIVPEPETTGLIVLGSVVLFRLAYQRGRLQTKSQAN